MIYYPDIRFLNVIFDPVTQENMAKIVFKIVLKNKFDCLINVNCHSIV